MQFSAYRISMCIPWGKTTKTGKIIVINPNRHHKVVSPEAILEERSMVLKAAKMASPGGICEYYNIEHQKLQKKH